MATYLSPYLGVVDEVTLFNITLNLREMLEFYDRDSKGYVRFLYQAKLTTTWAVIKVR